MRQSEWEQLILCYLQEKGYKEAEQAFQRSCRVDDEEMALTDRLSACKGVVEQLVTHFSAESDPKVYAESYERLSNWVDNALDMYRGELSRVLYPVFLHCYFRLVANDASPLAKDLLAKHRQRLSDIAGARSRSRAEALQALQGVVLRQHLETNQFAKQASSMKTTVRMSSYAYGLLMHFLCSNPQMLQLAGIINEHINLEVSEGPPQALADEPAQEDAEAYDLSNPLGLENAEVAFTNQQTVHLGLLKNNVEDKVFDKEAASQAPPVLPPQEPSDDPEGDDEAEDWADPEKKKKKKLDPETERQLAAAEEKKRIQETRQRVDPQAWVPQWLDAELEKAWMTDIANRAHVSPTSLPSCCLFTFVNARQSLNCAAFTPDVTGLAAGFADSSVRLYDLTGQQQRQRQQQVRAKAESMQADEEGGMAAGGTWGSQQGPSQMLIDQDDEDEDGPPGVAYLYGHTAPVYAVDYSYNGQLVFSGSGDGTVRMWSSGMRWGLAAFRGHMLPVWDVAAGPLGYTFASASADRTARIWVTDHVRTQRILAGHQADVDVVRWHPNCHYVATASSDRSVRLWDVASGACVRFLLGLRGAPTSMEISPDGRQVAAGGEDGSICIWDLGTAKRVAQFAGHTGPVWSLAYSRGDGALLASGGADETVQLWSPTGAHPSSSNPQAATSQSQPEAGITAQQPSQDQASGSSNQPGPAASTGHASAAKSAAHGPLCKHRTKASSVTQLQFSNRNLLLAAGSFRRSQK